jgi:ribulose-phosphate 3-epimerase
MKVAVSFIKSKYDEKETIKRINETSADYLHVDIMDGKLVENANYGFNDIQEFLTENKKKLDIHLMCERPLDYIKDYVKLKPGFITFHLESKDNPLEVIDFIHKNNVKCGISIKPDTELSEVIPYLDLVDLVLIMTVEPGKGGQVFMDKMVNKINKLAELRKDILIEADGGINDKTVKCLGNCDVVVSGSYICLSDNFEESIKKLKIKNVKQGG